MHFRKRPLALQCFLTLIGATAFCIFSQSWYDTAHLFYDIPAGLSTFGFIAQLVIEAIEGRFIPSWFYRLAMVFAMTVVTVGRQYFGWEISGHLSCVLPIALVQTAAVDLPRIERVLYWIPVPTVLYLRLAILEHGGHSATWAALVFALAWGSVGMITIRATEPRKSPSR
jgi:hypothetical protein